MRNKHLYRNVNLRQAAAHWWSCGFHPEGSDVRSLLISCGFSPVQSMETVRAVFDYWDADYKAYCDNHMDEESFEPIDVADLGDISTQTIQIEE
ncbi:hypothetical protein [Pseudomonas phage LUZ7]|uniref:Uncharacterized protein n=1 Tax=Pseudomonas phage LUZ7 TaxID=655097 RepID=C8ZKA2_9CAUD|nr:hypothetical protein PP-LUZ7_gp003 [Pseudomonas phage LUZ7]CAZ66144.1 hypothetical protein [Pseudomonas phage LUZ7]